MNTILKSILARSLALGAVALAQVSTTAGSADANPLAEVRAEHVMISTGDYDAAIAWYRDKLDFRVKHEWTVPEFPGVRLAYLSLNGFVLEIVETPEPFQSKKTPPDLGASLGDRGYGHMGFITPDVDAVAEELQRRGVELVVPPTNFPDSGRRLIFIRDIDGNLIEFLTPLKANGEANGS